MGFRDIAMFNDSLLAKKAWRLLKNPKSLFNKVFKARFFPNYTIMEAKHTSGGSHTWNSILHGRDVLLRGCWRIGNGKAISIWQHHWLPRKHPPQVLSPMVDSLADAKVAILIEETSRQWNHEMIDGIFTPMEAKLVKAIQLSRYEAEDSLFWPFTNDGIYTSKSGYRFLKAEDQSEVEEEQRANLLRLNKTTISSHQIAATAKERLAEFALTIPRPQYPRVASTPFQTRWLPPSQGLVKINCDDATFKDQKKSGIGVAIRDENGMVLASMAKHLRQLYTALEIEAMAPSTALTFATQVGFHNGILESDSLVLTTALINNSTYLSTDGLLMEDIRFNASYFNQLLYSHVKREGNKVAHKLVRHALCILDFSVWMEDVLPPIRSAVLDDIVGFS
ncbi:uncharacterized protein LOC142612204 [Castanea sativa]|uniref:uncharacterized protein LOC142612204 n=1 Tax=Castanea sativa TaxID=21020 RepID=UPI003F650E0E